MFRLSLIATLLLSTQVVAAPKTRDEKVREDKQKVEAEGFWIYNDLEKGFAEAKKSGKPLLVVLHASPAKSASSSTTTWSTRTPSSGRCSTSSSASASSAPTGWIWRCFSTTPISLSPFSC